MRAIFFTLGPSTLLLARQLATQHDLIVEQVDQTTSMHGIIVGMHDAPEELAGVGVSDGTRIQRVEVQSDEQLRNL